MKIAGKNGYGNNAIDAAETIPVPAPKLTASPRSPDPVWWREDNSCATFGTMEYDSIISGL